MKLRFAFSAKSRLEVGVYSGFPFCGSAERFVFTAIAMLIMGTLNAATIYLENFSSYSDGATSGTYWYIDANGCSVSNSDYFRVENRKLEARDTDCDATFYTYPIDISQYKDISLSADASESGNLSNSDRLQFLYSIDGGAFQHFSTNGDKYNDFSSLTASQSGLNGKTLVIKIVANNNSSNDYYYIDNILVSGTPTDNFALALNATNASCSTSGAVDLVVTTGLASSTTASPFGTGSCTVTLSGSNSYTLNSGQVGCVTGNFNGSVTINGGTLINAGSANISSLNFYSGTFINNGSLAISNFTAYGGRTVYNYGSMAVSGTLTIGDLFYNYGPLSAGSLTLSSGGGLLNNNSIQVAGDFTNNAIVMNNGSIVASGSITTNSGSSITNNGTLTGNALTVNAGISNNGTISVSNTTTINSSGSIAMGSGALLATESITINGSISQSGPACANVAVSNYTRINSSGSMSGNVQLCDANGVDVNYSSNYSGGAGLNCNCAGGGYTYQWSNGATTQDLSGISAGTYTVTVTGPNGATVSGSVTITGSGPSGNPAVFGNNQWIVYAWNAGDASGNNGAWTNNYSGYYTINSLNFDTRTGQTYSTAQSWSDNLSPSHAAGYVGCTVDNNNHSYAFKRQGFPSGSYVINLPNHDDRVQLYVNGTKVYDLSGCCATRSNIWSGTLGATSTLELRISEGGGGSHGSIELVQQVTATVTSSTPASRCGTGSVTLQATASSGCVIDWYASSTGSSVLSGGSGTNSFTTPSISSTTTYYAQARHTSTGTVSATRTAVVATINGAPSASIAGTNVSCFGQANGAATVSVSGGNSPYTYNWGGGITSQNRTGLSPGSYTVTVTTASGCTTSASITITQPATALGATASATPVSCGFCTDGVASVSATGGTAPYTYNWSGGGTSSSITSRAPGTYTVTVTDSRGCTVTRTAVINLPLQVKIAGASACSAGSGSATASGIGGTAPYTFVWSTGATTATISNLSSGTYLVTGTDAHGVTATQSVVISNTNIVAAMSPASATICQGQSVQLNASGADLYTWTPSTGLSNANIANPIANPTVTTTYSLNVGAASGQLVTNGDFSNGNTGFTSAYGYVNPPGNGTKLYPEGLYAVDSNANTYHGNFHGKDHTTGSGNFMIINGATLAGQTIWSQTVNITPNTNYNFSTWITSVNASSPARLRFEINGVLLGPVIAAPSRLNTWVQFNTTWNSGSATSAVISIVNENAAAGGNDYGLDDISFTTVCNVNHGSITVTVNPSPAANAGADGSVCTGGSTTLTASGAGSGGSYSWSSGASSASTTVSPSATTTYAVTVTNAAGCSATDEVQITHHDKPTASVTATDVLCYGAATGGASTTVSGGTTPYTYNWGGGVNTQNRTGLSAGNYTVTVTAANGCTTSASVAIAQPTAALALSSVNVNPSSMGASNGNIDLSVSGGTGAYTYAWSGAATTQDLSSLVAGTYTVTVTDANGCSATRSITLTEPVPCTCIASGDWTNPATWSGNCSGGGGAYAGYLDDVEIKGFQVVVDSTHTVKSLVLRESTTDITKLTYTDNNSLHILEDFNLNTISTGNNVEVDIDGSAEFRVNGDFKINHAKGTNVTIRLNNNNGNNAKLLINGNLDMTMESGSGDLFIHAYAAIDTIQVNGDILFNNNNTSSRADMFITMASSSKLLVAGDIDFNGVRNQNMELKLNNSSIMELSGSIVRNVSPTRYGKVNMSGSSTLKFVGADQQLWDGNTGNTDHHTYGSIVIENTSGISPQVVINSDVTLAGTLTLLDGNIGTGNDMVIVSNTSGNAVAGHSANSYVVGTLRRYIASNNHAYDFPLGYGEPNEYYWARITNNYMVGPNYLTASFGDLPAQERGNSILVTDASMTYTELKQEGIWTIDPNIQPILGSYSITVGTENFSGLMDNMFRVIKRPTRGGIGAWSNGNGLLSLLGTLDRLVSTGVTSLGGLTSFSEFGIAQGGGESLPIDLVSFGAQPDGTRVRLDWTVSMEINNDYFTIERSLDGLEFEPVAVVQGGGNHSIETDYQTFDENPHMGLSYYRLRQTDFDGRFKVYDMVAVTMKSTATTKFDIYPNPNKGSFTISLDTPFDQTNIMVLNNMGQMVYFNELLNTTGKTSTQLELGDILAAGIYFVKVDTGTDTFIKQMVIE